MGTTRRLNDLRTGIDQTVIQSIQPPLPELMKPLHPALVGANRKSHVVIGGIEELGDGIYAAPLILPSIEQHSPLNPYRDHVPGATMLQALEQVFIASRRQFHGDRRMAYRLMKSQDSFHGGLKPDEPATVVVSYGEPRILRGNTIYEVHGEIVDPAGKAVMKSEALLSSRPVPRKPGQKQAQV